MISELKFYTFYCIVLMTLLINRTYACNGYNITIIDASNCLPDNIVTLAGKPILHIDNECNVIPTACVNINKPFSKFQIQWNYAKNELKQTGATDICKLVAKQIPQEKDAQCPVRVPMVCLNGNVKYNIKIFSGLLGVLAGDLTLRINGIHDIGKSCFQGTINIFKQ